MLPDADAIREALRYLHPDGPWMVNAKVGRGMPGRIGADLDAAVHWAVGENGRGNNTYTAPARLRPDYTLPKKAKDVDVAGSRWLWADLDPEKKDKGLPFAERQAKCLARLTTERPADVPAPSAVIFSGGGYWGLWRLAEEVDPARLRAMLKWLAEKLGGDKTTDPSRIMRLSGGLAALLLAGYATALALHTAAARRAGLPLWLVALLPAYWLALWAGLLLALRDLARDPAHWRKTTHGAAPGRNTLCPKGESPQQSARTPAE